MRTKDFGQTTKRLSIEGKMSRKRQHSDPSFLSTSDSDDTDNIIPLKRTKSNGDSYCWLCHQAQTNRLCSTCIRSYHKECIGAKGAAQSNVGYRCDLCIRMDTAEKDYTKRNVRIENIHRMLGHVAQRLQDDFSRFSSGSAFSQLRQPKVTGPNIINPFDLGIVNEKIEDSKYVTTLEFSSDIRWIRHNAEIMLKDSDQRLAMARNMEELCDMEMYDIEMCGECFDRVYTKKATWFTEVCDPPHLVVWTRMHGHPYWPAKVIGLGDVGNNKIDVRFFGTHERQNILVNDCSLFSDNPNKRDGKSIEGFDAALKEVESYITNIESKYDCKVVRAKPKSPFNIKRIGKHLMDMIPALKLPKDFELKRKPSYLKKYRRRKAPNLPENNNVKSVETVRCSVRLEKCDAMIENILRSQEIQNVPDDVEQNEKLEPVEMEDNTVADQDEYEHLQQVLNHMNQYDLVINLSSEYDSENSIMCYDVSSASSEEGVIEAKTIEEPSPSFVTISNATPTRDMNDGTVKVSNDKTPDNETSMEDEELTCRKDPRTYERNSRPKAISGGDCVIIANKTQQNDCHAFARKSYGSLHSPNRAMRNENMASDSPKMDVTVENDEPTIDFDSDLTSHGSRHEQTDIVQSFCEVLDDSGLFSDVRSEPLHQTQSDLEPESPNYTEDNDDEKSEEITDQNSEDTHVQGSESELEPETNTEFQAVHSNAEGLDEAMISDNDFKQENENVDPLAIAESDTNEQNNEHPSITDQTGDAEDKSLDEAENSEVQLPENPSDTLDDVAMESIDSLPEKSPTVSESPESDKNETSAIVLVENSSAQPIDDKLKLLQEDNTEKENLIQSLKAELIEKNAELLKNKQQIDDLESQVARLKEIQFQVTQLKDVESQLNEEIHTLKVDRDTQIQTIIDAHSEQVRADQARSEQEILRLKADHEMELEKAIEETKNRKWCALCKKEAKITQFNPPTCSTDCLQRLWQTSKDSSDATAQDQIQVNGQVLLQHAQIPVSNGHDEPDPTNSNEPSFSEIFDY